jgi:pyroglutamyl-peptidase
MKILVTAFGPFDGRPDNASSLALRELEIGLPGIHTRILPVDAVIAPSRLKQALKQIRPSALIMLGEAAGSRQIRLETTAWNELDFRIPDIAGRQPSLKPIIRSAPSHFTSTLPLAAIHASLVNSGHQVSLSDDAGRYLCNQLFYVARHQMDSHTTACPAGFIHLPLAKDYPTTRAVDALTRAIEVLRQLAD